MVGPYQVLPLWLTLERWHYWIFTIRLFGVISKTLVRWRSYPSTCRILDRWTNNEKLADIEKYNSYFYSSTATFVWSRNSVRESSHISFFCGEDPFYEIVRRPENTYGEADRSAWETSGFLPLVQNNKSYIIFQVLRIFFLFMVGYRNLRSSVFLR